MWTLKYWKPLAAAAIIAAVLFAWQLDRATQYRKGYEQAKAEAQIQAAENERIQAAKMQRISAEYQKNRAEMETELRESKNEIDRIIAKNPSYQQPCFDNDGLQQLKDAINAKAKR